MSDAYVLLTGATGLLGRYLVRDLLDAGDRVACVVRDSRSMPAADRVEALMQSWERMLGRPMPRPVVLTGDITRPLLGLDADAVAWVRDNCDAVLHNAASLTFHSAPFDEEPYRSNVRGTQNALELASEAGIRDFHHVSTAYVCGLRSGIVKEDELDVGQQPSNDYERSKIQAEKLVREADFLSPPTVYRPAIIVGDSKTGFTTTFHGFYAMLRIVYTMAMQAERDENGIIFDRVRVTLDGTEKKNLVPVDWVSAAITHIFRNPEHHGKTYHLTQPRPVTAELLKQVIEDVNGVRGVEFVGADTALEDPTESEQLFYEHMQTYNAYWRNDPTFDMTNTKAACPHLPCPELGYDELTFLAKAAIELGFRWKDKLDVRRAAEVAAQT